MIDTLLPLATLGATLLVVAGLGVWWAWSHRLGVVALAGYSIVLSQSFPVATVGTRVINLSTDHLVIPMALLLVALTQQTWSGQWPWPRFGVPYIAFSGWALATLGLSMAAIGPAGHVGAIVEAVKLLLYTLLYIPAIVLIRSREDAQWILKHLAIAAALVLVVGYVQWFTIESRGQANIVSTFGSLARGDVVTAKNVLAVYLSCWLVAVLVLFVRGYLDLVRGLLLLAALGLVIVASLSRAALLSLAVALAWLYLTHAPQPIARLRKRGPVLVAVAMMGVVGIVALSAARDFAPSTPVGQALNLFSTARAHSESGLVGGATGTLRLRLLFQGLDAFLTSPIVGYGFGVRSLHLPALAVVDNFLLDVAMDTGMVGLTLMLWLMWEIVAHLVDLQRRARRAGEALAVTLAWGASAAVIVIYAASVSGSFPFSSRLLGTAVIVTAALTIWVRDAETSPVADPAPRPSRVTRHLSANLS